MPISDTTRAAAAVQLQAQRALSGEERLLIALEMSLFTRELARTRIRLEHPEWSDAELRRELLRLAFFPKPLPATLP